MKTRTNLVLVVLMTLGILMCASLCFAQPAPRCAWYEFWCSESVYRNPNVSPNTKRQLWEQDPNICHTDECRRARLAAGIEYYGLDPIKRPQLRVPPPPVYTPYVPYTPAAPSTLPLLPGGIASVWCSSRSKFVCTIAQCPKR